MISIFHKKDDGLILIDATNLISLVGIPTLKRSSQGIEISNYRLTEKRTKEPCNFVCSLCNEVVDADEIYSVCMMCGVKKSLNEIGQFMEKNEELPGVYCFDCMEKRSDIRRMNTLNNLLDLRKVSL